MARPILRKSKRTYYCGLLLCVRDAAQVRAKMKIVQRYKRAGLGTSTGMSVKLCERCRRGMREYWREASKRSRRRRG